MTPNPKRHPVTEADIAENFDQASEDDAEFNQHQLDEDARIEAEWLARHEESEPLGLTLSKYNPYGVFTPDGRQVGSTCNCEDYPCCGH